MSRISISPSDSGISSRHTTPECDFLEVKPNIVKPEAKPLNRKRKAASTVTKAAKKGRKSSDSSLSKKSSDSSLSKKSSDSSESKKSSETSTQFACLWNGCVSQNDSANSLYDHVMSEHIRPLNPNRSSSPSASSASSGSTDCNYVNEFCLSMGCQWSKCKMVLMRGTQERKFKWLEDHVQTRHSKGAQPELCIMDGCKERFSTKRLLEDHVRIVHIEGRVKKDAELEARKKELKLLCKEYPEYAKPSHPYFDTYWHDRLVKKLMRMADLKFKCSIDVHTKTMKTVVGAKWRKMSAHKLPKLMIGPMAMKLNDLPPTLHKFDASEEEKVQFDYLFPMPQ